MKKKLLAILFAALLLLALPAPALAAGGEEAHVHCLCGAAHVAVGDHLEAQETDFAAWTAADALPTESGSYYLDCDVTLSAQWSPADGTVLCLNGHTVTSGYSGSAIQIASGCSFTLTDCAEVPGSITHAQDVTGRGVENRGAFTMFGGSISGNTVEDTNAYGGGVCNGGTFTMTGGTISGNMAAGTKYAEGGGVYSEGTFTMFGGTISSNTAEGTKSARGGGVYNGGTLELSGDAKITNNTVNVTGETAWAYGGGVYSADQDSAFTMSGGTISGNTVKATGETAWASGGGVESYGTFELSGNAKISNNTAKATGENASACGGGVSHSNVFTMTGGEISGNTVEGTYRAWGGGVYCSGNSSTFELSGDAKISNNTAKATGEEAWTAGGGVRNRGTFTMTGGEISGNTLESTYRAWGGGVQNSQGGTFTMSGGTIANNTVTCEYSNAGGGVYNYGTFELSGNALITGNTARGGGGVYSADQDSAFTMSGGTISNNTAKATGENASACGGGVSHSNVFTMTGGEISGNTVESTYSASGGGVYNRGTFELSGGTITGNTADGAACNVYLDDGCAITVPDGGFTGSAGITTATAPTDTVPIGVVTGGGAYAACFFSDSESFELASLSGNLWLKTIGSQLAASVVTELALCCTQDVQSVDCVYDIGGTGVISSVELKVSGCLHEWNVKDGKLYLSVATSETIEKCRALAEVVSLGEITLTPVSLLVNGEEADVLHLHHGEETPIPELAPTCDKPGSTGGATCSVCGAVLEASTVLPALGPSVTAVLAADGTLTVSAVLSDDAATENTLFLAVYRNGRMLCCQNISALTQNDLHLTLSGVRGADTVKIFRLDGVELCNPLRAAIEAAVTQEA